MVVATAQRAQLAAPAIDFLSLFDISRTTSAPGCCFQSRDAFAARVFPDEVRRAPARGKPHWADAFLSRLDAAHRALGKPFIMGYQICFALFTVLVVALVIVALRITRENAFRSGVIAGILLVLIALTGGSGLAVILPVVAWLLFIAFGVWRSGRKDPRGTALCPRFAVRGVPLASTSSITTNRQGTRTRA